VVAEIQGRFGRGWKVMRGRSWRGKKVLVDEKRKLSKS
jgi:hypothetical protein